MSDTAIEFGRRIPRIARLSIAAPPSLIRWTLRATTVGRMPTQPLPGIRSCSTELLWTGNSESTSPTGRPRK